MRYAMILTLVLLGAGLAGCADRGNSSGYNYRSSSSQRSPSWTQMPSQRSSCGPRRNFC
jgi:hypothetical protein